MKKRFLFWGLLICATVLFSVSASAAMRSEVTYDEALNKICTFSSDVSGRLDRLSDGKDSTYVTFEKGSTLTVSSSEPIGGLYFRLDFNDLYTDFYAVKTDTLSFPTYTVSFGTETVVCGSNGFLHEYCPTDGSDRVTVTFNEKATLTELYVLPVGDLPSWVQVWRPAEGEADLLLVSAHSDDDQLYFAGVIPYALSEGAEVQVAFFTAHWNRDGQYDGRVRAHELLDSLWSLGLTRYPDFGTVPDINSRRENRTPEETVKLVLNKYATAQKKGFERIYSYDVILSEQVARIRKFRPQVIVTHDLYGEYGHGTHVLCASVMCDAVLRAADETFDLPSFERYGTWQAKKLYLHSYPENKVVLPIDVPLDLYGGKTAFRMSQEAFTWHPSQWSSGSLPKWLYGNDTKNFSVKRSSEIKSYTPGRFGLYYTAVGPDVSGTSLFDNVEFYRVLRYRESLDRLEESITVRPSPKHLSLNELIRMNSSVREPVTPLPLDEKKENPLVYVTFVIGGLCVVFALCGLIEIRRERRKNEK